VADVNCTFRTLHEREILDADRDFVQFDHVAEFGESGFSEISDH
jgi:hypothetical protein